MSTLLELRDVCVRFGAVDALAGIDLHIDRGESVALVGESGSGKSTLGRVLLRLLDPQVGGYTFDGQDVLGFGREELRQWRRRVQAVFQNPWQSLDPRMRIDRLITEPATAQGMKRSAVTAKAHEMLNVVGLPTELARRYPRQLSGGQRQRVAIGRALSVQPDLLVLDEPISALDVSLRVQILDLIRRLQAEYGMSVLYITHDLATVPHVCSRAYVLYSGRIFEQLDATRLTSEPDNPYTRRLLGSILTVGSRRELTQGRLLTGRPSSGSGCAFAPRCGSAQGRCEAQAPDLVEIGEEGAGWSSRCHFAGEDKPSNLEPLASAAEAGEGQQP